MYLRKSFLAVSFQISNSTLELVDLQNMQLVPSWIMILEHQQQHHHQKATMRSGNMWAKFTQLIHVHVVATPLPFPPHTRVDRIPHRLCSQKQIKEACLQCERCPLSSQFIPLSYAMMLMYLLSHCAFVSQLLLSPDFLSTETDPWGERLLPLFSDQTNQMWSGTIINGSAYVK